MPGRRLWSRFEAVITTRDCARNQKMLTFRHSYGIQALNDSTSPLHHPARVE